METSTPYIPHNAGDLITAEDWNGVQVDIRADIVKQIAAAIKNIQDVPEADTAKKFGTYSVEDYTNYILDRVKAMIPGRTGYMRIFCRVQMGVDKIIKHGLKTYPVVDVYELAYFPVLCSKGETSDEERGEMVNFFLYHADERRLRDSNSNTYDIETNPNFRVLWQNLLDELKVQYTDDTTLDDLEIDFWRAFFADPNDEFDPDSYCHSPWFEKCCGEQRTVADLKKHGDFDDIYLKVEPLKTINYDESNVKTTGDQKPLPELPSNVLVEQLDFDDVALRLLADPPVSSSIVFPPLASQIPGIQTPRGSDQYMPLMVLLKV